MALNISPILWKRLCAYAEAHEQCAMTMRQRYGRVVAVELIEIITEQAPRDEGVAAPTGTCHAR